VLDDVAFRPVLEQPAGKDPAPFVVGRAAHVELHESAGFRDIFPRSRLFTGLKAHDGVADAQRFTGLHRQVAGQAVALVEKADDRDAFLHRRAGQRLGATRVDA
jgi:hypothetical protein